MSNAYHRRSLLLTQLLLALVHLHLLDANSVGKTSDRYDAPPNQPTQPARQYKHSIVHKRRHTRSGIDNLDLVDPMS